MKKSHLLIAFTFTLFVSTFTAQGQNAVRVKEYGIGLSNLNSYSLQYRWGTEQKLYRINANIGAQGGIGKDKQNTNSLQDSIPGSSSNIKNSQNPLTLNFGLSFSILNLKPINEKFGIMYGGLFGLSYSYRNYVTDQTGYSNNANGTTRKNISTTKDITQTWQPYLGMVLGAYYKINPSFFIYAEIDPNFYYTYTTVTSHSTFSSSDGNYSSISDNPSYSHAFGLSNLSNSGATLTFAYRITK